MQFWVKPYDGEGGDSLATRETQWGLIECWHESEEEGCGGFAVYEAA